MATGRLQVHRQSDAADAAIVFVHGFGSRGVPFGRFPQTLAEDPALAEWDLYGLSYATGLLPDLRGLWEADPPIGILATYLRSQLQVEPLARYGGVALIAHSMGGLVCQRALVDDDAVGDRVSHLIMFGTPSAGLRKARWGRFLKQQIGDMTVDGEFIVDLRRRWTDRFAQSRPFELCVVAGDRDAFVPPESSLGPFEGDCQVVVPGDHLEIVDVADANSPSHRVAVQALRGEGPAAGALNSARIAVQSSEFDQAIRQLGQRPEELDEGHLVDLALALDGVGRRDDAIRVLTENANVHGTDAAGTLAGRYKRRWLASGRRVDGEAAFELYSEALARARDSSDQEQIFYLAINVAFLELALRRDHAACRERALEALAACELATTTYWRAATEAEALLYLDRGEEALEAYAKALAFEPEPAQAQSTLDQALDAADALARGDLERQIGELFERVAR